MQLTITNIYKSSTSFYIPTLKMGQTYNERTEWYAVLDIM